MPQKSIKLKSNVARWLLIVPATLILYGAGVGFCRFFGDAIAANAQQSEVAESAIKLAPDDPLAWGRAAFVKSQSFVPSDLPDALKDYETATALAPHDWRYWTALSKMYERLGDARRAELAARHAAFLAPNYAQTRWLLGNVLLRRNKPAEAVSELRRAAEADPSLAAPFINTVTQVLKVTDFAELERIAGDSPTMRAALVGRLIEDKKLDDAVAFWQKLPEKDRLPLAAPLAAALFEAKRIRQALPFFNLTVADANKPNVGQIINADFETNNLDAAGTTNLFFWQIAEGAQPNIGFDDKQKHSGARSLVLIFNSVTGQEFRPISQLVPVEANANYRLQLFAKTGDLRTSSTMRWEIVDGKDDRVLATTSAVAANGGDWQNLNADFKTNSATEAVRIRLARVACGLPPCSIVGKVWFDDFSLQKIQ